MKLSKFIRKVGSFFLRLYFKKNTKLFNGRLPYLHIKNNSEALLIVFSGFDKDNNVRQFNYVRKLWSLKCDKLYISDPFGYRGSYYWFENGDNAPEKLTLSLVNQIVIGGGV